jgi:serine/threonine-protein kinase
MEHFEGASGTRWSYDPVDRLGDGGFGVVFGGKGPNDEDVAVKRLDLNHPRAEPLDRLMRETEIGDRISTAGLAHLLPVVDHSMVDNHLLLVMERAERSLASAITSGMPEQDCLAALRDISAGLVELHGLPILHRDLKPPNVLWHGGKWKLADFGIARDLDQSTATMTWKGYGTLRYMAPELFAPPFAASVKSDLYAFGCLAYELLVGHPPFDDPDRAELMRQHREDPVAPLPNSVNVTLRRLVMRLLEKDPIQRPQDARAVEERLGRVVLGPLSDEGLRLQKLTAAHVDERSAKTAAESARLAEVERAWQQHDQAASELRAIVEEGYDLIAASLPEVEIKTTCAFLVLEIDEAALRFQVWDNPLLLAGTAGMGFVVGSSVALRHREDHVAYGSVEGDNDRHEDGPPLGNIVCEVEDGRMKWILYRYKPGIGSGPSTPSRQFGFLRQQFFTDGVFPFAFRDWNGLGAFSKEWRPLTAEAVQDLFVAALALPSDP